MFHGKQVLIVGAGESGSDICNEIADEATKVAIAVRGKHGHLIPRKQADGRVTDLNTNRCRYSNPCVRRARRVWLWCREVAARAARRVPRPFPSVALLK